MVLALRNQFLYTELGGTAFTGRPQAPESTQATLCCLTESLFLLATGVVRKAVPGSSQAEEVRQEATGYRPAQGLMAAFEFGAGKEKS